jgi:hypothetical protein
LRKLSRHEFALELHALSEISDLIELDLGSESSCSTWDSLQILQAVVFTEDLAGSEAGSVDPPTAITFDSLYRFYCAAAAHAESSWG